MGLQSCSFFKAIDEHGPVSVFNGCSVKGLEFRAHVFVS